jgi:hypothetical protein
MHVLRSSVINKSKICGISLLRSLSLSCEHLGRSAVLEGPYARKMQNLCMVSFTWSLLTPDRLRRQGLRDIDVCALCAQEVETLYHLLVDCMFSSETWFITPRHILLPTLAPYRPQSLATWWCLVRKQVAKARRKGFFHLVGRFGRNTKGARMIRRLSCRSRWHRQSWRRSGSRRAWISYPLLVSLAYDIWGRCSLPFLFLFICFSNCSVVVYLSHNFLSSLIENLLCTS